MKYFKVVLLVLMMLGLVYVGDVMAGVTDTCAMSVTVTTTVDLTLTDDPLTFGSIAAGNTVGNVSTLGATLSNSGTGNLSYQLQISDKPSVWTALEAAGNPGAEQFKLLALFTSSNPPAVGDFNDATAEDVVKTANTTATSTVYAKATEAVSVQGYDCTATSVRKLWFKFIPPSTTSLGGSASWITVTITAL